MNQIMIYIFYIWINIFIYDIDMIKIIFLILFEIIYLIEIYKLNIFMKKKEY